MGIGVDFTWDCGDDIVLWLHAGELEMGDKTRRWKGTMAIKVV
jgi:hypothetical protein